MKKAWLLGGVIALFVLSGCSNNLARFSMATTSNLPVTNVQKGEIVKGKDCITEILWFGIGNTQNRVSGAVANAIEQSVKKGNHADALINVDISHSYWSAILFGRDCITAQGQAISIK
ncbi:hypothetical protein [uncultured Helicobacter sp.]|uniref:hypothetical protein n=1 Tax=uncultured Helicobacter sp. TaxID=175537 RepID=UPI00374F8958